MEGNGNFIFYPGENVPFLSCHGQVKNGFLIFIELPHTVIHWETALRV